MTNYIDGPTRAVASWIKEAMVDHIETNPCTSMVCNYNNNGGHDEVVVMVFGDKIWTPESLAEVFIQRANHHVAEMPGTHLFTLLAFYGGAARPSARRNFRINNANIEPGNGTTEPPTPTGEKMQGMRHNEVMFQTNMKQSQFIMAQQTALINSLGTMLKGVMTEAHEVLEVAKTTTLQRAEVEAQKKLADAENKERSEMFKMLPTLLNNAFGTEIIPQPVVNNRLLENMLEKVDTPEKMEMVAAIWGPEIAASITAIKTKEFEGKNRAITLAKKVGEANADSELDEG